MTDLRSHWILKIDEKSYQQKFREIALGADLATQVAKNHGYSQVLKRILEGTSLVFQLGSDFF